MAQRGSALLLLSLMLTTVGCASSFVTAQVPPLDPADRATGPLLITSTNPPTSVPGLLLPDLTVEPPGDIAISRRGANGEREVRFSTTVTNIGAGAFELRADHFAPLVHTGVVQRIFTDDGSTSERVAGVILFNDLHAHWHFEEFVQLDVLPMDSPAEPEEILATTGKISFCLIDIVHQRSLLRASPHEARYRSCSAERQGISVGWADVYGAHLPGQQVSVEHLPDGRYSLRLTVDPEERVLEQEDGNNTAHVLVEIEGMRIRVIDP